MQVEGLWDARLYKYTCLKTMVLRMPSTAPLLLEDSASLTLYTLCPENTHKLMGFYMEVLIIGVNTIYMLFCFFKLFPIGYIG